MRRSLASCALYCSICNRAPVNPDRATANSASRSANKARSPPGVARFPGSLDSESKLSSGTIKSALRPAASNCAANWNASREPPSGVRFGHPVPVPPVACADPVPGQQPRHPGPVAVGRPLPELFGQPGP